MEHKEVYSGIFSQQINQKNITIVRKFFTSSPPPSTSLKNQSQSHHHPQKRSTNSITIQKHKNRKQFTAGFQPSISSKLEPDPIQEDISPKLKKIVSNRMPSSSLHSFLLGFNNRINQTIQAESNSKSLMNGVSDETKKNILQKLGAVRQINKNKGPLQNSNEKKMSKSRQTSTIQSPEKIPCSGTKISFQKVILPSLQQKPTDSNQQKPTKKEQYLEKNKQINKEQILNKITRKQKSCMNMKPQKNEQLPNHSPLSKNFNTQAFKMKDPQRILIKGYLAYDNKAQSVLNKFHQQLITLKNQDIISSYEKSGSQKKGFRPSNKSHKSVKGITASNYLAINLDGMEIIAQRRAEEVIEVASLTKIMTCYLCLLICQKYHVDSKLYVIRVSDKAALMPGTSAELQAGDVITLYDLLYGLMLPSGNDASVAIAETAGKIIQKFKKKLTKKTPYETFISHMNLFAKELGIEQSFQNPSGLSFNPNFSSPKAMALLTLLALQNQEFKKIVNCKNYEVEIKNERFGLIRRQQWNNTNKLLWKDWKGVKTGTTQSAGHCLMACRNNILVGVYNCESLGKRFSECELLYKQLVSNQELQSP